MGTNLVVSINDPTTHADVVRLRGGLDVFRWRGAKLAGSGSIRRIGIADAEKIGGEAEDSRLTPLETGAD
jgi:hypothetical protein